MLRASLSETSGYVGILVRMTVLYLVVESLFSLADLQTHTLLLFHIAISWSEAVTY